MAREHHLNAPRIGFLGAYSIDNTGDAISGYAARRAVRSYLPNALCLPFAPAFAGPSVTHDYSARSGIDCEITPVPASDAMDWVDGLDALLIGGGGLAMMYEPFRPFFLGNPRDWERRGIPAAWNGLGSQDQTWRMPEAQNRQERMRSCCESLRYVSVRNQTTARFVRQSGYDGPLFVIPEPAILLPPPPSAIADSVLERAGVPSEALLIGVSVGGALVDTRTEQFYNELIAALDAAMRDDPSVHVVLFPFGYWYADAALQDLMHRRLPSAHLVRDRLSPLECWSLVGRMSAYIGARFHSIIAAFNAGVPCLALDEYLSSSTASSKIRDFVVDHAIEDVYICPFLDLHPRERLAALIEQARRGIPCFVNQRRVACERLDAHYRSMLSAVGLLSSSAPGSATANTY